MGRRDDRVNVLTLHQQLRDGSDENQEGAAN